MYQYILTAAALGISSFTDLRWHRVYGRIVVLYLILAILGHVAAGTVSLEIVAGIMPGIFFMIVSWVSRQGLGYGDSLLLTVCGAALGFWPCVWMAFTAFFWSGIWALVLYWFRREGRKKEFSFVPFLFLGFVIQCIGGF